MLIRIKSHQFTISPPFSEGHQLTLGEAQALNGLWAENIRHNLANRFAKLSSDGHSLTPDRLAEFETHLAEYCQQYRFYAKQERLQGQATTGPFERALRQLAEAEAQSQFQARGRSPQTVEFEQLVTELTSLPTIRDRATEMVKTNQQIASKALEDLLS